MPAMDQITDETIALIRKAQTAGLTVQSGLVGYDLSGIVSWVPVVTPTRDRITRKQAPIGSTAANWRTMLNVNSSQPNPFTGLDAGGGKVNFSFHNMLSNYFPIRQVGGITLDAIDLSRGYDDSRARAVGGTLMQWRIAENKGLIGGQAWPLAALTLPALTTSTTGGAIAATTAVYVKVQARSAYNYYWGGSGIAVAANITTGAGSTNTVTIPQWTAVPGAVAYDVFAGPSAGTLYYVNTQTHNGAVTFTSIPTVNAALPNIADLWGTVPTPSATDTSSNATAVFNGFIASIYGDYAATGVQATPGTGDIASGATLQTLNGATLTGTSQGVTEIDNFLLSYFGNTGGQSPDFMLMNGQQSSDIKKKVFAGNAAVTYLEPQGDGRVGATVGGSVATYVNGVTGSKVEIIIDPHLPPGRILFGRDSNPYPDAGEASVFEVRTQREVAEHPYGTPWVQGAGGGPADTWDVSSMETFINRAPVLCGAIADIAAG